MKKITSLLTAVCITVVCISAAFNVSAETTSTNKELFTDDFSGTLSSWICKTSGNPEIDKNLPDDLGGSNTTDVLWVWGDAAFGYNLETPVTEGKVVFSFDIDPNKMANYEVDSERGLQTFIGGENLTADNVMSITTMNRLGAFSILKPKSSSTSVFRSGWGNDFATNSEDNVAVSGTGYRHVDIVVDMDSRCSYTYLEHMQMGEVNSLPEAFVSVNSIMFNNYLLNAAVYLDNVKIIQNPTMEIKSVEENDALKCVDIEFNQALVGNLPEASAVTIKHEATGTAAIVTEVTKPYDNVLRVAYRDALVGGRYTVRINGAVESIGGSVVVNNQFDAALTVLREDFAAGTQPMWLQTCYTANTTVDVTDGKFKVKQNTSTSWNTVIKMNVTADESFEKVYNAIKKGGTDGSVFTAETCRLGKLSYEFDLQINTYGGTVVLYGKDRHFRINTWTTQGFHAGNSNQLCSYNQSENHNIKVVYDFEAQKIAFYIDGEYKADYDFTQLKGEEYYIAGQDVFNLYLGVSNECEAVFDNFVIKYTAADSKLQDFKLTDSGNKTYTLTGSVVNPFNRAKNVTVIFAAYKNDGTEDNLVYTEAFDATTTAAYQNVLDKAFAVPDSTDYDSVKVFVWDNFEKMIPLGGVLTPQ